MRLKNRRLIESYKSETESKRKEITELASKPVTFQAQRCQACGMQLDLPIVHFLCKHSYHQRCLNQVDGDVECPSCQANNETIRAIRRSKCYVLDIYKLKSWLTHISQPKMNKQIDMICSRQLLESRKRSLLLLVNGLEEVL